jgi:hypothetical protein
MAGGIESFVFNNFSGGVVQDYSPHLIPDNALWRADNMMITKAGSLQQRGPTASLSSGTTSRIPLAVGAQNSFNVDDLSTVYAMSVESGTVYWGYYTPSSYPNQVFTGLSRTSYLSGVSVGVPTNYGDNLVFPLMGDKSTAASSSTFAFCGGHTSDVAYSASSLSISVTSNKATITVGSTPSTNTSLGSYVHLGNGGTNEYTGRVVAKTSTTITVDPVPTITATYTTYYVRNIMGIVGTKNDGRYPCAAKCVGVFSSGGDSRLALGNVTICDVSSSTVMHYPNRIIWSVREASDSTITNSDGLVQLTQAGWPQLNYIDIEDIGEILGLVPTGSGNMLVLGTENTVMLSGSLVTQSTTRGGVTASIRQFPEKVGCLSDRSIQRTSRGVFFASASGVYLTDGVSMVNVMRDKIQTLWTDLIGLNQSELAAINITAGTRAVSEQILGSANVHNDYYYLSTVAGGFVCDLNGVASGRPTLGWTMVPAWDWMGGPQALIGGAATYPQDTNKAIYAIPFLETGASSSLPRLIDLKKVFYNNASYATGADADGVVPVMGVTTKSYSLRSANQLKRYRHALFSFTKLTASGVPDVPGVRIYAVPGIEKTVLNDPSVDYSNYNRINSPTDPSVAYWPGAWQSLFRFDLTGEDVGSLVPLPNIVSNGITFILEADPSVSVSGGGFLEFFGLTLSVNPLRLNRTSRDTIV